MNERIEAAELFALLWRIRDRAPLVHHITNYVTVNDCANITLAVGGSPVMADDSAEAGDMAAIAQSLVINIGTCNARTVKSMLLAGRAANEVGIPVILDPVGCGATPYRTEVAETLLREIQVAAIRGNISEMAKVAGISSHTKGVDASVADEGADAVSVALMVARKYRAVAAVSGKTDIVTDGKSLFAVENGCAEMSRITGTGCMETSVLGAFCGANPDRLTESVLAGMVYMGLCGEIAQKETGHKGVGSFHVALIDAAETMTEEIFQKGANYHAILI